LHVSARSSFAPWLQQVRLAVAFPHQTVAHIRTEGRACPSFLISTFSS